VDSKKFTQMAPADFELLINLVIRKLWKGIPDSEQLFWFKRDWQ